MPKILGRSVYLTSLRTRRKHRLPHLPRGGAPVFISLHISQRNSAPEYCARVRPVRLRAGVADLSGCILQGRCSSFGCADLAEPGRGAGAVGAAAGLRASLEQGVQTMAQRLYCGQCVHHYPGAGSCFGWGGAIGSPCTTYRGLDPAFLHESARRAAAGLEVYGFIPGDAVCGDRCTAACLPWRTTGDSALGSLPTWR